MSDQGKQQYPSQLCQPATMVPGQFFQSVQGQDHSSQPTPQKGSLPLANNQPAKLGHEAPMGPYVYAQNPSLNNSSCMNDRGGMNLRMSGPAFYGSGFNVPRSNAGGNFGFRPSGPNSQGNPRLETKSPQPNVGGHNTPSVWMTNRFNAPN